jgi:thiosulfate/3-mercaptopyruvate sulfurtransferase
MADPLVSPQWLAAHLRSGTLVLDIRSAVDGGGAAAYEAAHVPGAVHTDYAKDGIWPRSLRAAGSTLQVTW